MSGEEMIDELELEIAEESAIDTEQLDRIIAEIDSYAFPRDKDSDEFTVADWVDRTGRNRESVRARLYAMLKRGEVTRRPLPNGAFAYKIVRLQNG